jgi:hypothetical protein
MALPLYGKFKPVQTSNNSSNRKKEKKYCSMEIGIPTSPPPGSTHPQTNKELNYTLKLVTPGRTFLQMSRTHSDFIVTIPGENSSKCQ